ncbi:MAG: diacylglycerol/lipid kinase family protein [Mucilaginibacter sp.]|uniref:diacylglycerol/lipid kinase family protein n=1 Tax=Mucilaginibacter sp. L3T2-6 TaxID=3062491 RepID=UPI0026768216|nr:diacylglycerol kinase family protein [Mucilaginibacter sp. L3T2-6]MDO3640717.1 diacylglycerol kinase family lipid kinase [Mucilaginibacter sp. L3T2-6]MDV6212942.1 diacylglycerol kinase family lipid kinase [Mucilaginibacter sp. L3T2-6]
MERKALFIINPISGGKKKDGVPELIEKHLDAKLLKPVIVFSDGVAHATQIAKEAAGKFGTVVAVGGDGTVNEIASAIVGSDTALGIVPFGSGNGLSRFLHIPMDTVKAIENLTKGKTISIDSATLNGKAFFNMAGMGFDAHIAEVFSHNKKRGFISYIKMSLKEVINYKPQVYQLEIDGKHYEREAFMLSFANSSQYGNDAHVSPHASVQDGLLDVCIIKPFPLWRFLELAMRMMAKTADKSRYVEIIRGRQVHVKRALPGPYHLDGEPHMGGTEAKIELLPGSLKIIAGNDFV